MPPANKYIKVNYSIINNETGIIKGALLRYYNQYNFSWFKPSKTVAV